MYKSMTMCYETFNETFKDNCLKLHSHSPTTKALHSTPTNHLDLVTFLVFEGNHLFHPLH